MQMIDKTIIITGGTSGIGCALVRKLYRQNKVLVVARPGPRLDSLQEQIPGIDIFGADLSNPISYQALTHKIINAYPRIDILINNAAVQHTPTYLDDNFVYDNISAEINVNFTAICALSYLLLPALLHNAQAIIININSGLAFAPKTNSAIYCASKSAVDAFSRSLGYQLHNTNIHVQQAFLPLVDTAMTSGRGKGKMSADEAAHAILTGIQKGYSRNYIGKVKLLTLLIALAPGLARKIMRGY